MYEAAPAQVTRPPSLRRRLLVFLLVPMLVLLVLDAVFTYAVALAYANRVGDSDLANDARSVAQLLRKDRLGGELSEQAKFLLEYDPGGHNYFSIVSRKRGTLTRNGDFPAIAPPAVDRGPVLYDSHLGKHSLRVAALSMVSPRSPDDVLTVTIAETLRGRHEQAREILLLTIPMEALLAVGVLSLVWLGVNRGLRILDPLTQRIAAREHELGPISGVDVPREILPLTRTIDALFARLRSVLAAQERFLADAAHQLRTPLTGLSIHVERALGASDQSTRDDALWHIQQLTGRAARTSTQLLAITRAQSPLIDKTAHELLDLERAVPDMIAPRIYEAMRNKSDLGFEGAGRPVRVRGDTAALTELLNNLIDNALRYAGHASRITASVSVNADGAGSLRVEDDGPGVADALMGRLGERFFRESGHTEDGTGLGLAIVQQIVRQHQARLRFETAQPHGLVVIIDFPAPKASA